MLAFVYFILVACLVPTLAYAWGPGTHLEIAMTVLENALWVTPAVRKLIQAFPDEYIYGNVSPDITVGKKYAGAIYHCHNWSIGKLILEEAKTDADRAAAWGYLTHLTADVVAHNYFVPYQIIHSYPKRRFGHIYWEMRMDLHVEDRFWNETRRIVKHKYTSFDYLLERVLKKTLFSFRTNKNLFNSIVVLQKLKHVRAGLKKYSEVSRWEFSPERREHYREVMWEAVRVFLKNPEKAPCLIGDPSGQRKLLYASQTEKELRKLSRGRSDKEVELFLKEVRGALLKGLYDSEVGLPHL